MPDAVVAAAARGAEFFALNAAPARPVELEPDLLIVNRLEHEVVSRGKLVAVTYGAEGAALFENGREVARATPPRVDAVDGTAAGDAFAACLVVSLLEGRPSDEALARACAAGALAASRLGAQPSLPGARRGRRDTRGMTPTPIILDCDPGHDDAIAILLAVASPELELVGVTTVSGNQTLDKTTANALRVLEFAGRVRHPGLRRRRQAVRAQARRRGARARRVRARRPRPAAALARGRAAARGRLPRRARSAAATAR